LLPGVVCVLLALAVVSSLAVGWLPAGLVWAVFAWSVSIAVGWTLGRIAGLPVLQAACHAAAFSAAWWTVAAAMAKRWPNRWAGEAVSAFVMTAAASGVAVAVMLAYDAALVGIWRLYQVFVLPPMYVSAQPWQGLMDLALLGLGLLGSLRVGPWKARATVVLWLLVGAGLWWGLTIPPWPREVVPTLWPTWLSWTVWLHGSICWPLLPVVLWWVWSDWKAQEAAWPRRMSDLVRVSPPPAGLEASAGVIGLAVVPSGLWHAFWVGSGVLLVLGVVTVFTALAATALSVLVGRRWNQALAELSLAVWSVAILCLVQMPAAWFVSQRPAIERLPVLLTGGIVGLAISGWFWPWLAGVWRQQLDGGRAWTTAGRMVPLACRMGFMAAALGVLLGAKMALWPLFRYGASDDTFGRIVAGSLAYALLAAGCVYASLRWRLRHFWGLVVLSLMDWGIFLWLRA